MYNYLQLITEAIKMNASKFKNVGVDRCVDHDEWDMSPYFAEGEGSALSPQMK